MSRRRAGKILVVDDEAPNIRVFSRLMRNLDFDVLTASSGDVALHIVAREDPDLILLDVNMPGIDGFEVCRRIKNDARTRLTPVVLVTALSAVEDRVRGIEAGADDFISKPPAFEELAARVRSLVRLKRYTDELDSAESVILSLALTIEARDPYTRGHCERLASYASALGVQLGLDEDQQFSLYRGGFLHDVGKIAVPDSVLLKPGRLVPSEWELMQGHTVIGDDICKGLRSLEDVRPIIRHHHERLDGSGYPDHLAGDAVPLLAQIISVVDAYDAMTTNRPYKKAESPDTALGELRQESEQGIRSAALVEAFAEMSRSGVGLSAAVTRPRPLQRWRH